jgi:NAD-dependent dihydropyrimidine dehydrogenase PreA subunit
VTYVIAAPCVDHNDKACVDVCPIDCISADPQVDRKFHIDPEACIECGQCASVCPNDAIFADRQLPAEWVAYARIDAVWYSDPSAARQEIDALHPN